MAKKKREHEGHKGGHHALSGHGHHANAHRGHKAGTRLGRDGHDGATHADGMAGEHGMSPRKAMASGVTSASGNFGVESFERGAVGHGGQHPDAVAKTGAKPHLEDHERGIGHSIHHTRDHHPAQAAPDHGPHHPGGHMRGEHGASHDMVPTYGHRG